MARAQRTRRVAAATARQTFSQLLSDVRRDEEPVIIEKAGVPVAAVVPLSVLERDRRWAEEREQRIALLERLRRPLGNAARRAGAPARRSTPSSRLENSEMPGGPGPREDPLTHHRRHPRSFLDVSGRPDEPALAYRAWCLDCDYEVELDEDEAERWADRGVPWRTGTE